jgi:hypothetical protein
MARIIKIDAYDIITSKTETRHINADNVIEVEELLPTGDKPLTRIKMSDGSLIYTEKTVDDVTKQINS